MPKPGPTVQHILKDQHERGYWNVTDLGSMSKGTLFVVVAAIGRKPSVMNVKGDAGLSALKSDLRSHYEYSWTAEVVMITNPELIEGKSQP
jgi:thiamine pyrophosphate-dependent acetolactate synthase large subunit-like protein